MIYTPDPINWDHPDNAGLVMRLTGIPPLDGGPKFWDLCGRNHGTLINYPVWTPTDRGDAGLNLDGTSQAVQLSSTFVPAAGFTVAMDFVWKTQTQSILYAVSNDGGGGICVIQLDINNDGTVEYRIYQPGSTNINRNWRGVKSVSTVNIGDETHLVATWLGGDPYTNAQIYINGYHSTTTTISEGSSSSWGGVEASSWWGRQGWTDFAAYSPIIAAQLKVMSRGVDAAWVARDYVRSLDLSRDDTLRRLSSISYFFPSSINKTLYSTYGIAQKAKAIQLKRQVRASRALTVKTSISKQIKKRIGSSRSLRRKIHVV